MSDHAVFSHEPGTPGYGATFTRAGTALYVNTVQDLVTGYWSGKGVVGATYTRASTATYVLETTAPV